MIKSFCFIIAAGLLLPLAASAQELFQSDIIKTAAGELKMTFIGHASLMFEFGGMNIYFDPVMREADYSKMPSADLILITHEHSDHFDLEALKNIRTAKTILICPPVCKKAAGTCSVIKNGEKIVKRGITIQAIPAYNILHKRRNGQPFHPKGIGNGYIMTFGDKKVYIAGDTEDIPEMRALTGIDIAFLPMNLPYTMTLDMTAAAAEAFRPHILYPYHFGDTNTQELVDLLKNDKDIEVRIRRLR